MADISRHADAEREAIALAGRIERAKKELENMIDLNPSVLVLVDGGGTILRGNIALLRLLGRNDFSGLIGRRLRDVFASEDPDFFEGLRKPERDHATYETRVRLPAGGTPRDFRFTVVAQGEVSESYVVIVNDVTDEKRRSGEAEKLNKQEAVHALAGALMHNLNQNLTVITVETHMMMAALEKGNPDLEAMKKELRHIRDLVMEIANVLSNAERSAEYVTESYPGGESILSLKGGKA